MLTDIEKTLKLLQDRGESGIHSFELNKLVGTTRSAARIQDLKDKGYQILSMPEKVGDSIGVRYYLVEQLQDVVISASKQNYRYEFYTDHEGRYMARRVQA